MEWVITIGVSLGVLVLLVGQRILFAGKTHPLFPESPSVSHKNWYTIDLPFIIEHAWLVVRRSGLQIFLFILEHTILVGRRVMHAIHVKMREKVYTLLLTDRKLHEEEKSLSEFQSSFIQTVREYKEKIRADKNVKN